MNHLGLLHVLGWAIAAFALAMLPPAALAALQGLPALAWTFAASAVLTAFFGAALLVATRGSGGAFGKPESYAFVVLVWILLALFGALPFYFAEVPAGAVNALFESASGLSTTGATVLQAPEAAPAPILLWRALLQGVGGFLTLLLVVVLLSYLGIGGLEMFASAMPRGEGVSLPERLAQTARDLGWVYAGLVAACSIALWVAGMPAFDALCHGLSTLSTGGFSTRSGGVAAFDSRLVEAVLAVFMLVAAVNFTLHWALFNGRRPGYLQQPEVRYLIAAATGSIVLVVLLAGLREGALPPRAAWDAAFAAISALTTTGYSSTQAPLWASLSPVLLIGLLLVGGCTGSSTGGMKLLRVAILFKHARRELDRLSHPHGILRLRIGPQAVADRVIWAVWSFFFVYILFLAACALLLALATEMTAGAALIASAAAITNTGPAPGLVHANGPDYADLPDWARALLAMTMLAGRMELLTLLTLLNPAYWRH